MKILEVVYGLGSGGAERLVVDLCNELSQTQDVTLLILKDVEQFYLPQVDPKVDVIQAHWGVGFKVKYLFETIRLIKQIDPDIVHFHSQARYSLMLANILLGRKYKFYMTIHSDVEKNYASGISGLQVRLCGHLGNCKFITISQTNEQQFHKVHPKLKQALIPNGRALPKYSDELSHVKQNIASFRQSENTLIFIHVARCSPVKNQQMLVRCFNRLRKEGLDCALLVLGSNFDSPEGLQIQADACKNIHFLGAKTNVYDYLACADAFCLSSIYEGMPMSIIEALLSGIPVISTPTCGAIDVIQTGKNGILAEGFEEEDLHRAILAFVSEQKQIIEYAKSMVSNSPLSIAVCAKKHIQWFQSQEKQ